MAQTEQLHTSSSARSRRRARRTGAGNGGSGARGTALRIGFARIGLRAGAALLRMNDG